MRIRSLQRQMDAEKLQRVAKAAMSASAMAVLRNDPSAVAMATEALKLLKAAQEAQPKP